MKREDLWFEALKTFGGAALGLALLVTGWIVFSNNGFDSAWTFFLGSAMLPTGLIVAGTALTGELGESPRNILAVYYQEHRLRKYRVETVPD